MIKAYIRSVYELDGHLLGEFEAAQLPRLVQAFRENPTYADDGTLSAYEGHHFMCYAGNAYFEIIIDGEGE